MRRKEARASGSVGLHARLTVSAVDSRWLAGARRAGPAAVMSPPPGVVHDTCTGDNVTCVNGLTAFAGALVWSGIQDQAVNLGVTSPSYLTPLYGAVGSGGGTPASTDTALFSELARVTVGAGAASPATVSIDAVAAWLFYFAPPASSWTVTEAGMFGGATAAPGSGTLLDHYALASAVTITSPDTCLLQVAMSVAGS
jgi:hypothetical protein